MALHGIIGDMHGNREALLAALAALGALRPEQIWCVGDIVGYNADPNDCVAIVRKCGVASIAGNHDLIASRRLGFRRCSNKAMHALRRTRRVLEPAVVQYLQSLPATLAIGDQALLIHGGVRDVQQYLTLAQHIEENVRYLRSDFPGRRICFFGHMHEQTVFEVGPDGRVRKLRSDDEVRLRPDAAYFINPGSVDASRKRGPKMAEFALFDSDAQTVRFFRTPYDDALSEARAAEAGYRVGPWRDYCYTLWRRLTGLRSRPGG